MAEQEKKTKNLTAKALVIGLCVSAGVSALAWFGLLQKVELILVNQRYVNRPKVPIDTGIITIDIDDPSIDQIGRWPWTWDRHTAILDLLWLYGGRQAAFVEPAFTELGPVTIEKNQARQIAMGVSQLAQGSAPAGVDLRGEVEGIIPDYNKRFLRAVEKFPNTYIGDGFTIMEGDLAKDAKKVRELSESYKPHFSATKKSAIASLDSFSLPWPDPGSLMLASDISPVDAELSKRIAGTGFMRIIQDIDGIVRRTPLLVWYDGRVHPSIALSMAAAKYGCPIDKIRIRPGKYIEIPGKEETVRVPIDKNGNILVNWAGKYQETFLHLPYNVIALHYAHRLAKQYVRQFHLGLDSPQDVMQKLGEFVIRQRLVPQETAMEIVQQIFIVWIMDDMMDHGVTYDALLKNTGWESSEGLRFWWDQLSVNKRAEEVIRSGQQDPSYSAVLISLDIKDTDIYREGFDHTLFFYKNGRINEVRPLFFMPPSIIDVSGVEMKFSPLDFKDKTLFVGLTATGLNAFNPTPYQERYQMFGMIPNIYNTLVTRNFLRAQSPWMQYLYILLYSLAVTWMALNLRPILGFAVVLVTWAVHFAAAWLLFIFAGVLIPIFAPVLAVVACYVSAVLYRYVEEQRERKKVRGLFGAMVSPEVLRMMEEKGVQLSGEKHEATMFSSDVSGFTTISEGVTAQELADILNIYLTPMSNIIMNFDGYVDKYEGDAIKADFGVPVTDANHAWKGCLSALLQQEELKVIQRLLLLKYGVKITARMGVNTGFVAAGNMGSEKKMQYTVMGDAVTLAEELEPINKLYESWIAIGPLTYEKSHEYIEVRHLDRVLMGPAAHPTDVYELMGWKRNKFMEHWSGRPVPPLFIEAWRKLTPEKILGYIHYWDSRTFDATPFYKDLRALFDKLGAMSIEAVKSHDIVSIAGLRAELEELNKAVRSFDTLLADLVLDRVCQDELDEFKQHRDKAAEDWLKLLWSWKVQLKENQFAVQHLFGKIPNENYEELLQFVDTHQKRVECCLKRISFPKSDDTVGFGFAEHLKTLLMDGKPGADTAAAQAKKDELLRTIRQEVDLFLEKLPKRAPEFHEFMADHCPVPEYKFRVRDAFDEARKIYLKMDWDAAEKAFKKVLEIDPKDGPAQKYIERVAHLRKHPPAADWDGNWAEE